MQIREGHVIHADHAAARTRFDGHVAQRHARFHVQPPHRLTVELDHMAIRDIGTPPADDRQSEILGVGPFGKSAINRDPHSFHALHDQALRRQEMLDVGSPDTKCQGAEGAMRGRMGIAARDGHAGQDLALLRSDDMKNALANVLQCVERDAVLRAVPVQCLDLQARDLTMHSAFPVNRRNIVIRRRNSRFCSPHAAPCQPKPIERLRARDFVHEVTINI